MVTFILSLIILLNLLIFPVQTFAQENALTVSPSIMQIDLTKDKPEYQLVYKNNTSSNLEIELRPEDFKELEEGWKINFLDQKESANYKYSLSSWISFETSTFSLKPRETKSVKVLINGSKLSPGGHYGSIVAKVTENDRQKDTKNVQIKSVLASLLFVRSNTGQEEDRAEIDQIYINQDWWRFPFSASFKVKNSGNTYFTPFGVVEIYDFLDNKVGKAIINENGSIVLPGTLRRFDLPVLQTSAYLLPGIYTANIRMHGQEDSHEITKSIVFFSIGNLWVVVLGGLIIVFLASYLFRTRLKRK